MGRARLILPGLLLGGLLLLARTATADEAIFEHLEHAERVLRAADTAHLTPGLRRARAANLDRLREYRQRRRLPRNIDHPGQRVPYFIDDRGVACAMAHLVIASGHPGAARAIAGRENNAYLVDMRSPELGAWLAGSGLTAREAAFIQPSYEFYCNECEEQPEDVVCGEDGRSYANACWARRAGTDSTAGSCPGEDAVYVGECDAGGLSGFVPRSGCSVAGAAPGGVPLALPALALLLLVGRWARSRGATAS